MKTKKTKEQPAVRKAEEGGIEERRFVLNRTLSDGLSCYIYKDNWETRRTVSIDVLNGKFQMEECDLGPLCSECYGDSDHETGVVCELADLEKHFALTGAEAVMRKVWEMFSSKDSQNEFMHYLKANGIEYSVWCY